VVSLAPAASAVAAGIVGNSFVRAGAPDDAVGGVVPSLVVSPGSEDEVAALLSWAWREGLAVVVRGGGTKMAWGAPPRRCDVVLSMLRVAGVVEHEPGDLVCVVRAGTPLASLQGLLAAHGQRLALDPPHGVAATIGGIMATGAWGPLRTSYGTARDLVLGCRFVLADGTVGHSGGKVVKNVAGYDIAKLLIGSLGTLAVITEVSLRLHPLPRVSRTVAYEGLTAASAAAVCAAVAAAAVLPAAIVVLWPEGAVLVTVEGTEVGVAAQIEALGAISTTTAVPRTRLVSDTTAVPSVTGFFDGLGDAAIASIAVPRTHLEALLTHLGTPAHPFPAGPEANSLRAGTEANSLSARTEAHSSPLGTEASGAVVLPSLGVAVARMSGVDDVVALRTWAASLGGHVVLHRAPPSFASVVWPEVTDDDPAFTLMRAIKNSLDPTATLSPGRFLGGI
jgi:glycolate oxidase FAD binding subunit